MSGASRGLLSRWLVVAVAVASPWIALDARANAARPWDPGDPLAEPVGRIPEVGILRETLVIDARPFADGGPAEITATYRLLCSAEAVAVPLVFVSPGIERGEVTFDGVLLALEVRGVDSLPPSWQSPDTTPDAVRGALQYADDITRVVAFTVPFERGEHELRIRYAARPTTHHGDTLIAQQLAYVLAPARDWATFGGLDLEVLAPAGWTLDSQPPLVAEGDGRWRLSSDGLPDDAVSMTFRPPRPLWRETLPWLTALLAWAACALIGHRGGVALARRRLGWLSGVLGAFVLASLGAAALMGAWLGGRELLVRTLPQGLVARETDYDALAIAALALLVGFVTTGVAALRARSRAARSADAGFG